MIFKKLLSSQEAVAEKVFDSVTLNKSLLLTYFNQHCFNIYCEDNTYRNLIEQKFDAYQADLGVYLAAKFLNHSDPKHIESTAMNEIVLKKLITQKIPVAIIGGSFKESFIMAEAKNRGINLTYYKNGFFDEHEYKTIITQLNGLDVKVIFVGMGVPKQELFAEKLSMSLQNKIIICVGIFFEYYFGTTKRAPLFFRKIGFEWMFRLFAEPRRLWKRYILGIPLFIYRVFKIKFGLTK